MSSRRPPEAVCGSTLPRRERADAAANRQRILIATRALIEGDGAGAVTVASVAEAAGVGAATVLRRFGDKAGLLAAVLDEEERELQEAIVRGPPPLGPGRPPTDRLVAFLKTLVALTDKNADILLASETARAGARYRTGAYAGWQQHVALLLGEACPGLDAALLAHLLLAPLAAESYDRLRHTENRTVGQIQAAVCELAAALLSGRPRGRRGAALPPR